MNRSSFLRVITSSMVALKLLPLTNAASPRITTSASKKMEPSTSKSSVDLSLLLHCIAQVETGNDDTKVGRDGERSRYQISNFVYRQHLPEFSFRDASMDSLHWVAWLHVQWLDKNLPRKYDIERNMREYALAWAWNGGLKSWTYWPATRHDLIQYDMPVTVRCSNYAVRVCNLYTDAQHRP